MSDANTIAPTTAALREAKRALEQMVYHAVMEFAPWPMAEVEGKAHVVQAVNPSFCALLEKTEAELLGRPIAQLFIEGHATHGLLDRVQLSGEAATHVETARNTPGPVYWSYTCWPVQAKDARHVGLMIQVSETSEADQQTKDMNEALLISSVQQHELTDVADRLNVKLLKEMAERAQAEKLLQQNHDTFFNMIESAPFGVYVIDAQFRLRQASSASLKVFSSVVPLMDRDFEEIMRAIWPEPFAKEAIGRFRHTLATGEPYTAKDTTEQRLDIPEVESYDWKIERIILPDGQFGVVCYFYDISESKRVENELRASEERFRSLFTAAPMAVFVCDTDAVIQDYNALAVQLWGREPVVGMDKYCGSMRLWLPDGTEMPLERSPIVEVIRTGVAAHNVEVHIERPDGTRLPVLVNFAALKDAEGTITGAITSFFDITEQKKTQEILREADRRKSEFLATLAHELRNPLAPLRNGLELLTVLGDDRASWDQTHGMMTRQLEQMVRLIDDLMDVSRISRGAVDLRMEQIDLRTVLEQAMETSRSLVEQHGHTLVRELCGQPLTVQGDGLRLTQVFTNLLNNAAKYTDRGGVISVRAEAGPDEARVTVEDNGIGIAEDQLMKVFDMFAQVDRGNDRAQGGLGIGLNIVKHLISGHGGRIEVQSDGLGKGSRFTVAIPLATRSEIGTSPITAHITPAPISRHRILVVDDNEDAAEMMAMLLGRWGHEVQVAHNGQQAIEAGELMLPHLVFMDLGMPVMDGHTACAQMKRISWGRAAHIVALTGLGQEEDLRKSAEAGFDHHLVKPVGSAALKAVIADLSDQDDGSS